jgi:glycosyltransferase 2 family protein
VKKSLQIAAGLIVSALCLWVTFRGFDLSTLRAQTSDYRLAWVLPGAFLYCFSFSLRSARWRWILMPIRRLSYWTVAPALVFGFFMNSVLPARGGEFARAIAISKKGDIPVGSVLGSIVAERTLDLFGLLAMMIAAARLLPWEKLPVTSIVVTVAVLVVAMVAATIILPRLPAARSPLAQKVISFVAHVGAGFSVIRTPRKMFGLALLSILIWTVDALAIVVLSYAAGLNFVPSQAAALLVGIAVGVMIPAAPGYVGTYEFFGKETLLFLGFAAAPALAFILSLHFFQVMMITLMGVPSMLSLGLRPGAKPVP